MDKQREEFEKWVVFNGMGLYIYTNLSKYADSDTEAAWQAWQAAKAKAIPEGFVLVPKEPTQELLNKMQDFFVGAFENGLTGGQSIHCAYIAMIEAQEQANDSH